MTGPCYYHPQAAAVATCVQCGMPVCEECHERVQDKSVCKKCVGVIRARLEKQMAASPAMAGAPAATNYNPSYSASTPASYGQGDAPAVAEPLNPNGVVLGIVAGALIGLVGTLVWEKIYFLGHFSMSYFYILIGYGVGFGVHKFAGRGGAGLAALAVGIMLLCLFFGHVLLANDMLGEVAARDGVPKPAFSMNVLMLVVNNLGIMHWICLAIGVGACFRAVEQQPG